jgi:hypothetical protein
MKKPLTSSSTSPSASPNTPQGAAERAEPGELAAAQPNEVAAYIEQIAGELAALARSKELGPLAYLLEMAKDEAGNQARIRGKA